MRGNAPCYGLTPVSESILYDFFTSKCRRLTRKGSGSVFAVGMARRGGNGYLIYDIEDATTGMLVGIVVGSTLDKSDIQKTAFMIWAALGADEFSVSLTGWTNNECISVKHKSGTEVNWSRSDDGRVFVAEKAGKMLGALNWDKLTNTVSWASWDGTRKASFKTSVYRPFLFMLQHLFRGGKNSIYRNDDIVYDSGFDYGAPGWGIGGALLAIRMDLSGVDFS